MTDRSFLRRTAAGAALVTGGLLAATGAAHADTPGDTAISPAPADPRGGLLLDEVPTPGTPELTALDLPESALPISPTLPSGGDADGDVPLLTHQALPAPALAVPAGIGQAVAGSSAALSQAEAGVEGLIPRP